MEPGSFDFGRDIRSEVMTYLPRDSANTALNEELQASDPASLLVRYLNWRDRLVHAHPRKVILSAEVQANPLYLQNGNRINRLYNEIRNGVDLTPRLSERVKFGYLPRDPVKPLRDNPSLDLMLNEWGMHHLHISHDFNETGFVTRDDPVLVIIFREHAAFVVDMIVHGEWADTRLVEIVYRNWPNENLFVRLNGFLGTENQPTAEERKRLRRAGVSTYVIVDGAPLMSGTGGISTAGTSTKSSMDMMRIMRNLEAYEHEPEKLVSEFMSARENRGVEWPKVANFKFKFLITPIRYCSAILEMQTTRALSVE